MKSSTTLRLIFSALIFVFGSLTAQAQKGTLDDLTFLEGRWLGTFNDGPIEAGWSAPAADNIIGYIRMMKDNKYSTQLFLAVDNQLFVFLST